jgi:hypothetical protein
VILSISGGSTKVNRKRGGLVSDHRQAPCPALRCTGIGAAPHAQIAPQPQHPQRQRQFAAVLSPRKRLELARKIVFETLAGPQWSPYLWRLPFRSVFARQVRHSGDVGGAAMVALPVGEPAGVPCLCRGGRGSQGKLGQHSGQGDSAKHAALICGTDGYCFPGISSTPSEG